MKGSVGDDQERHILGEQIVISSCIAQVSFCEAGMGKKNTGLLLLSSDNVQ